MPEDGDGDDTQCIYSDQGPSRSQQSDFGPAVTAALSIPKKKRHWSRKIKRLLPALCMRKPKGDNGSPHSAPSLSLQDSVLASCLSGSGLQRNLESASGHPGISITDQGSDAAPVPAIIEEPPMRLKDSVGASSSTGSASRPWDSVDVLRASSGVYWAHGFFILGYI